MPPVLEGEPARRGLGWLTPEGLAENPHPATVGSIAKCEFPTFAGICTLEAPLAPGLFGSEHGRLVKAAEGRGIISGRAVLTGTTLVLKPP